MVMKVDIGIAEKQRQEVAEGLSRVLADSFSLYLKTHAFHWNVTGPMFTSLHQMFEAQYTELWTALDLLAERIRAVGAMAPGSFGELGRLSSIKDTTGTPEAMAMVEQLLHGHEAVIRTIRAVVPKTEACGDQATLELLTARLQVHEKTAWMLRSVLTG